MKRLQIPQKVVYEKFYAHEKFLRTRNCRRRRVSTEELVTEDKGYVNEF